MQARHRLDDGQEQRHLVGQAGVAGLLGERGPGTPVPYARLATGESVAV